MKTITKVFQVGPAAYELELSCGDLVHLSYNGIVVTVLNRSREDLSFSVQRGGLSDLSDYLDVARFGLSSSAVLTMLP